MYYAVLSKLLAHYQCAIRIESKRLQATLLGSGFGYGERFPGREGQALEAQPFIPRGGSKRGCVNRISFACPLPLFAGLRRCKARIISFVYRIGQYCQCPFGELAILKLFAQDYEG